MDDDNKNIIYGLQEIRPPKIQGSQFYAIYFLMFLIDSLKNYTQDERKGGLRLF